MFIELHEGKIRHFIQVCHIVSIEPYTKGDRGAGSNHSGCQVHTTSTFISCDESYEEVQGMLTAYGGSFYVPPVNIPFRYDHKTMSV